jgi:hypothetical protein
LKWRQLILNEQRDIWSRGGWGLVVPKPFSATEPGTRLLHVAIVIIFRWGPKEAAKEKKTDRKKGLVELSEPMAIPQIILIHKSGRAKTRIVIHNTYYDLKSELLWSDWSY